MKKVLLIVIDALSSRVLLPALEKGDLPHFAMVAQAGQLYPESIAIFPSLTPAATASIVTGYYPEKHKIMGFHWYEREQNEVVYYGDDFWVVVNRGLGEFFEDMLFRLNHQRLQAPTLFQRVEEAGLRAACLNYLIFRGNEKHTVNVPLIFSLLPGVPFEEEVYGPSFMYFGDLVATPINERGDTLERTGGIFHRFGFEDENTGNLLLQMAQADIFPDLTLAYFPDNDFESHKIGPKSALTTLKRIDEKLGKLIEARGGLEKFLAEHALIITGDHSQSDMVDDADESGIPLDELLADFRIAPAGKPWTEQDQLLVCPDMRSAQIYLQYPTVEQIKCVARHTVIDPRVDQVIWRSDGANGQKTAFNVSTLERGQLRFWAGRDGPASAVDLYGNWWSWQGSLDTVDGQLSSDGVLTFGAYPNAFERIAGALNASNGGHVWATSKLGYEFCVPETAAHSGGGSHGSLHALDSTSPLIVAGAPLGTSLPPQPRTVDIAPLCLQILNLPAV